MKRYFSTILVFVMALTLVLGLCACSDDVTVPTKTERQKTKYLLVAEGVSEYIILLSADAAVNEYKAAQELQSILQSSTGATLSIVYEGQMQIKNSTPLISIGDTEYAASRGVNTDGTLGRSGYIIKNIDNQLFIKSDGDKRGCLYAVWDFLCDEVGYRYYYVDEIYYRQEKNVYLCKYDDTVKPSFDFRSTWYQILSENEDYRTHLRYSLFDEEYGWKAHTQTERVVNFNSYKAHAWGAVKKDADGNVIYELDEDGNPICEVDENGNIVYEVDENGKIVYEKDADGDYINADGEKLVGEITEEKLAAEGVPVPSYVAVPDYWFSNNNNAQLCWTAGEELELQAATDIYNCVLGSSAEKIYFSMGQSDGGNFCTCPRCEQAKKDWAMNDAGLQINFANHVVELVQEWVKRDFPEGRDVRIVLFAYKATETPPMVSDGNGGWKPYSDKVIPHEKLYFELAPINTDYSTTLEAVSNKDVYDNLTKWHALLNDNERMSVWTYETNYSYFMYPFNNFDTFQPQMKTYYENGISNMFSQGPAYTNQPTFQEMRLFVESQIMWDVNRSYDELATEFINAFYKDASAEVKEYYDLIRALYEKAEVNNGASFATIYDDISTKEVWTEGVVDAITRLFERAYQKIEHYKTDDLTMWQKLYDRLKEIELTITYTKLNYYRSNYTQAELNVLIDEYNYYCSKYGINIVAESGSTATGLFDSYRQ